MRPLVPFVLSTALPLLLLAGPAPSAPDEGMWTFDDPPTAQLEERYGFEPTQAWLDHLRLSSVRVNDGGSGSFISAHGLVLTNHHVGEESLEELSTPDRNLAGDGFLAHTQAEELPCPDLEFNVLVASKDVTERVQGAVAEGASEADARKERQAEIARIEKDATDANGMRNDVIELYSGGRYALYTFKKYTDIKLVFAPEEQAAYFGGDPDNFTFPRYCLDMCIFRVYEDGKPADTPNYLRWNTDGPAPGDLVFVSGNPGSTGRLSTMAQLTYLRDDYYPLLLRMLQSRYAALEAYSDKGDEETRRARGEVLSVTNSIKALTGYEESLENEAILAKKAAEEKDLRAKVAADPKLAAEVGSAWDDIAGAEGERKGFGAAETLSNIRGSRLFTIARHVVRLTEELQKPNDQRLPEYRESGLKSLELDLYSDAPIYPDLEEVMLTSALDFMAKELGPESPLVKAVNGAIGTAEASSKLVAGSRLADPAYRKQLVEGGVQAVQASDDPMIRLALAMDPIARKLRKQREEEVSSVEELAGAKIARARFALYGSSIYPDATFTPRLSFGTVRGYEACGWNVPWKTTFYGLFERAAAFEGEAPYELPDSFAEAADRLAKETPYDFVCTADIIGGNSGSPVVDRAGELVGLVFDGNIQMLGNRFVYDDTVARTVAVHAGGMVEALHTIYGADDLLEEILGH